MAGLELLTTLSCMSDRGRWSVNNFVHPYDISDNDKELIKSMRRVGEGELTGIGAGILVYDLLKDVPDEFRADIIRAALYINLIVIEEFRHGIIIGVLNDSEFIPNFDLAKFGEDNLNNLSNEADWDIYGLLVSLCLSECVNTELYRCVSKKVECEHLKSIFNNIMKDEARHLTAWKKIIAELVEKGGFHEQEILRAVLRALHTHNASIGGSYVDGVKDTFQIFDSSSIDNIVDSKLNAIKFFFNGKSPISRIDLKRGHLKFVASSISSIP